MKTLQQSIHESLSNIDEEYIAIRNMKEADEFGVKMKIDKGSKVKINQNANSLSVLVKYNNEEFYLDRKDVQYYFKKSN